MAQPTQEHKWNKSPTVLKHPTEISNSRDHCDILQLSSQYMATIRALLAEFVMLAITDLFYCLIHSNRPCKMIFRQRSSFKSSQTKLLTK